MSKVNIRDIAEEVLADFLEKENLMLWHTEFKKEGKDQILRIYIDKEEGYISTDECEKVSRFLDAKLDEIDPVSGNYYLEVSSPGMDRQLYTKDQYMRYIGEEVEVKLFKAVGGKKKIEGPLAEADDSGIVVTCEDEDIRLPWDAVAKTNLKVIF